MAIDNVVASLLRVPLFAALKPLQITEIARQAERCSFRRGDVITTAGTPGDGAYLILSGDTETRPGPSSGRPAEPIEPGALVGELAMLVDHVYRATVVADGRVQCLKLTRAMMHGQMLADPDLAKRLARVIGERLTLIAAELQSIQQLLDWCAGSGSLGETGCAGSATIDVAARGVPVAHAMKSAQPRGRSWAQEARHAHSARREAGT